MKHKHLTLDDREKIEEGIKEGKSFTEIGKNLGKHRTTISKEVLNHRFIKNPCTFNNKFVDCVSSYTCPNSGTKFCNKKCDTYKKQKCKLLELPPYVCNSCSKRRTCRFEGFLYRAKEANNEYLDLRKDCRTGVRISKEEIYEINSIITPLIKDKHQSINHVYINHPDLLYFSLPTLYSYINSNLFSFRNIDLPRKVKYKVRKDNEKRRTRTESIIRLGRTYKDFLDYLSVNPNVSIVEMDTVEGIKSGKVFLTLIFRQYNFMLIYLMDSKTMDCVEKVFKDIRKSIGNDEFKRLFEVILTDNGSEFFNPISIETDYTTGEVLSRVFYCDPYESSQKGCIEKNHEYIRYVLPKKTSFNNLTQEDCYLLASHINSTCRIILGNKCPYLAIKNFMSKETLDKLNITYINPDEVNLSSKLLKKGNK